MSFNIRSIIGSSPRRPWHSEDSNSSRHNPLAISHTPQPASVSTTDDQGPPPSSLPKSHYSLTSGLTDLYETINYALWGPRPITWDHRKQLPLMMLTGVLCMHTCTMPLCFHFSSVWIKKLLPSLYRMYGDPLKTTPTIFWLFQMGVALFRAKCGFTPNPSRL